MRRIVSILAALVVASGCGGGGTGPVTPSPPPPPPPSGSPTTLSIVAGNDQTAEPGSSLPIKPLVVVRDAAGHPVAGVAVTFVIEAGGGTLESGAATSGSDGTAGPGNWHLGNTEGPNAMRSSAGALTAVTFAATAAVAAVTFPDQNIAPGGGTVAISRPGSPLDGARLDIPAGAFTAPTTWRLEQRSAATWPRRDGINPMGPALRISSTASGLARTSIRLTLPAVIPPGSKGFILMRDGATGAIEALPTFATGTTVTALVRHFHRDYLQANAGLAGLRTDARGGLSNPFDPLNPFPTGYNIEVIVTSIPVALLNQDVDVGYRPSVDDWEFHPLRVSSDVPGGTNIENGMTMSSLSYFAALKPSHASLWKKYQEANDVEVSNRLGIRAAAYADRMVDAGGMLEWILDERARAGGSGSDQAFYDVLKANLLITRLPQLLIPFFQGAGSDQSFLLLTVYKIVGGEVFFANPYDPGIQDLSVSFSSGGFGPLRVNTGTAGGVLTATWLAATGAGMHFNMGFLAGDILSVLQDAWPIKTNPFSNYTMAIRNGTLDPGGPPESAVLILPDTARMFVTCLTCKSGYASTVTPLPTEPFVIYSQQSGWTPSASGQGDGIKWNLTKPTDQRVGVFVGESEGANKMLWLDWVWIHVKKWVLDVTPSQTSGAIDQQLSFDATITGPPADPYQLDWDFGDLTPKQTTSPGVSAKHIYQTGGPFPIKVVMRRMSDQAILSVATAAAVIDEPIYTAWMVTSMTTTIVNDTRAVDTRTAAQGNIWLSFLIDHGPNSIYDRTWSIYRADSTFLYTAQSSTAAITLVARDTLLGPPFSATTGFLRSIYWWTYGSYPTSAATPLTPGIIGSGNSLIRGGTSCVPRYSARFSQTGTTSAGRVTGLNWVGSIKLTNEMPSEPLEMFEYDISFNGDVATGTTTKTYRLGIDCTGGPEVTWSYKTTISAVRIR